MAGVGVTWYTWLEQGRPINASPQVLDAVAGVLRLDRSEHAHLYRLADMPEVPVGTESASLPGDMQAILDGFTNGPACVYNGKFDLFAWNADYASVFPSITADDSDRNALRYAFLTINDDNPLGSPEVLAHMVAIARSIYGRHVGEPEWTEWVRRMSAESELFAVALGQQPGLRADAHRKGVHLLRPRPVPRANDQFRRLRRGRHPHDHLHPGRPDRRRAVDPAPPRARARPGDVGGRPPGVPRVCWGATSRSSPASAVVSMP